MFAQLDSNEWNYFGGNIIGQQPPSSNDLGTSITPGINNSYGSYTNLFTLSEDCYGIRFVFSDTDAANQARDMITTIGVDPTGGTSYTTLIPDLITSCASDYRFGGGYQYYFPLFIKAGSRLAAKASVNNATARTLDVAYWTYGKPKRPDLIRFGTRVEAIGVVTANSAGTSVTSGTTSEGSWTALGTSSNRNFYWQIGMGVNDSSMGTITYALDLSADNNSTTPKFILNDVFSWSDAGTEAHSLTNHPGFCDVAAGTTIYGRMQASGTPDSNLSMAAYGVS